MTNRQPITMENIVGNKVLIHLHRQAYEMLSLQGVDSEKFIARVAGVDGFGLWIENPNYTTIPVYDDGGEYIAPEHRAPVTHRAVVLLMWPYIQTILQFPDRTSFMGSVEESEIGFKSKLPKPGEGQHG
jgi:hypothetical protein